MLGFADFGRPEDLHEIARLRFSKIVEIVTQVHFMKEARGARSVRIPPAPDAFAIPLTADHQAFESRMIEMERAFRPQHLDRFHEDEISRARAVTRRGGVRNDEEFSRFEMRRLLQSDRRHARSGVAPAFGHLPNLFEDEVVIRAGGDLGENRRLEAEGNGQDEEDFRKTLFQNGLKQIELERSTGNSRLV